MTEPRHVIVGAGPAGMRAAERLVAAGVRPVVIDEGVRHGGQIYRQPPVGDRRDRREIYGFEAARASAVLDRFAALLPGIDYRPETLVWHAAAGELQLQGAEGSDSLHFDALILATGATDRVLPFVGWTLPGVYTLGAAQIALKYQACLVGPRVVFAGTGPLLYLVAWQYASQGGQVAAVLDTAPASAKLRAVGPMMSRPTLVAKGAFFIAALLAKGVPVSTGVTLLGAEGRHRIETLHWRHAGHERVTRCDAVAFGHGLKPETQLADLMDCEFDYSDIDQTWLPRHDVARRSSVRGVYLAGDGASILGADASELAGTRAAMSALEDFSSVSAGREADALERGIERSARFRGGLEIAFAMPADWAATAPDDLILCRCEEITAGELRACVKATGARELNRLKAFTRIGMGRCQGRVCSAAAARLLADAVGCPLRAVGRLRSQPPIKPLPIVRLGRIAPTGDARNLNIVESEHDD